MLLTRGPTVLCCPQPTPGGGGGDFAVHVTNSGLSVPHKVALTSSQRERVPIDSVVYCFFSCPYVSNVPIFLFLENLIHAYNTI